METLTQKSPSKSALIVLVLIAVLIFVVVIAINQTNTLTTQEAELNSPSLSDQAFEVVETAASENI